MAALRIVLLLGIPISLCFAHTMPGRKEDEHYKDGKHNDAYDHETFLGEDGHKEFHGLEDNERILKLGKLVDKIDKNGDNNISNTELADWMRYISLKQPTEVAKRQWAQHYSKVADANGLISWENYLKITHPGSNHDERIKARIEKFRKRFIAADENKDTKLNFDEFVAFQYLDQFPRMYDVFADEVMAPLDKNNDGVITLDEFQQEDERSHELIKREFEYRDIDKSGTLEKNEIKEWYFPTTYDPRLQEANHLIHKADSNKDNVLTRKEILTNYEVFVGSRVTHWGETLKRPVDEL